MRSIPAPFDIPSFVPSVLEAANAAHTWTVPEWQNMPEKAVRTDIIYTALQKARRGFLTSLLVRVEPSPQGTADCVTSDQQLGGSISTTSTLTSSLHSETQELQLEKTPFELIIPNQELTSWHASHHRITYTCNYVREWGLTAGVTGDHLAMRSWGQAPDSDFYFHGARSLGPHPSSDSAFSATHLYGFVTRRQNLSTDRNLNYSKLLPMVVFFYGDSHIDLQKI